jgi:hypothetical protein
LCHKHECHTPIENGGRRKRRNPHFLFAKQKKENVLCFTLSLRERSMAEGGVPPAPHPAAQFLTQFQSLYVNLQQPLSATMRKRLDSLAICLPLVLGPGNTNISLGETEAWVAVIIMAPNSTTIGAWSAHFPDLQNLIRISPTGQFEIVLLK